MIPGFGARIPPITHILICIVHSRSVLGKRKRAQKPVARKKKAKSNKAKPKPKNQPSISAFFAKVKK